MAVAKVNLRYQVTIPAEVRRKAKIRRGSQVRVDYRQGAIVIRPLRADKEISVLSAMAHRKFAEVWAEEPDDLWEGYL